MGCGGIGPGTSVNSGTLKVGRVNVGVVQARQVVSRGRDVVPVLGGLLSVVGRC